MKETAEGTVSQLQGNELVAGHFVGLRELFGLSYK